MLFSVDTTVRGRFSEKRCGPSRRCARNASAALENFVCYPQKTFSTASVKPGNAAKEFMVSAFAPIGDIPRKRRHPPEIERQPKAHSRSAHRILPTKRPREITR